MAITGAYLSGSKTLSVFGDALNNDVVLSRNAAGTILVNSGAVKVLGGTPTVANTALIQAFGQSGNDTITLNEANGALPAANLFGGAGNDVLTGGSGNDMLFGQADNDTLLGKGGNDFLFGGDGNDTLTGGDGDDQMFGEAGNDRMIWNPGDDNDLMEGGAGNDTAEVNGGNGAEVFTITANGARVRFDRVSPAPFFLDIGTTENLVVNANGGDDVITASNGLSALIKLTIDGGTGNDTITGGDGNDTILGGDGNDTIIGGRGNDTLSGGASDDTFVWNPGDGSDTVEGQDGSDKLIFNGANISETINIDANGSRVRFTRDVANIVMDVNGVETIHFTALGGADNITVGDLSGTGVIQVEVDLSATPGSGTGDGAADTVTVTGTSAHDSIEVVGSGSSVAITGLSEQVQITGVEAANDKLVVKGGGDNDLLRADSLAAGVVKQLTLDGGAGDDTILGSQGADILIGGDGADVIGGNKGDDVVSMGAGGDTFQWAPGDGNDTIDGGDGFDAVLVNGANIAENVDISANGGHVRLTRDVGNVVLDIDNVERVDFSGFGGVDNITVGDLSGTDATQVNIGLNSAPGNTIPDGQVDTVTVNGSAGFDNITLHSTGSGVSVDGLSAQVNLFFPDATDKLTINGQAGDDTINASALDAGKINLTINGGLGNDVIIGSAGDDLINGGDGNDVALMGAGDDTFTWNPGDDNDTVEGQDGNDTLLFNGANISENIDISANGARARFFRDIANVTMDVNGVETIHFNALGGTDNITVHDMSGTDVTLVDIDLAGTLGGTAGDNQPDTVTIQGTSGDDVIVLSLRADGALVVDGLATQIVVEHFDDKDTIHIVGLDGDDVIDASGLPANGPKLILDGGNGNDIIIGGDGNDVLHGDAGDDVLIGGPGFDILDGGPGDNILLEGEGGTPVANPDPTPPSNPGQTPPVDPGPTEGRSDTPPVLPAPPTLPPDNGGSGPGRSADPFPAHVDTFSEHFDTLILGHDLNAGRSGAHVDFHLF